MGSAVLHLVGLVLVLLDFAVYLITLGPLYTIYKLLTSRSVFAKAVAEADINGNNPPSKIWRSVEAIAQGKLTTTFNSECATMYDGLKRSYKKFGDQNAQGILPLLKWQKDEGERFPAKVFGPTQWRTFAEVGELAHAFGAGLRALGVEPQPKGVGENHKGMLIYDETSAEWMITAQGAISQDVVVATAYATLGIDAVIKACKQGAVTVLVCNRKAMPAVLKNLKEMPTLLAIVYTYVLCTPEEYT